MQAISQPLTIVLIGATGDLAKLKILKALFRLYIDGLLPHSVKDKPGFTLIGNARKSLTNEEFRAYVKEVLSHELQSEKNQQRWQSFADHLFYVAGDSSSTATISAIGSLYQELQASRSCGNLLWYLATLPQLYTKILESIRDTKVTSCADGWTKLMLEKPFGTDLATAQELNKLVTSIFPEEHIFRLDHFLGKETVQNILAFRFANGFFENIWNNQFIDHVQVTLSEKIGVESRGRFYDGVGVVRDLVQNHIVQMIAVALMEEPRSLEAHDIRDQRHALIEAMQIATRKDGIAARFGQYTAGVVDGTEVGGYLDVPNVAAGSITETAVVCKALIATDRWRGVPVYIRAGKRLASSVTELSFQFKEPSNRMFAGIPLAGKPSILTLRIQPNEGIVLRLKVKKPGIDLELDEVPMQFCYQSTYQMDLVEAYQKLIYDAVVGNPTLFPRADGIENSWKFVEPLLTHQESAGFSPESYAAGSWGPASFDELIQHDKRNWLEPSVDVCALPMPRQ